MGAGGAGRARADELLIITRGTIKTVANHFKDGSQAARAKSGGELEEDEAEVMPQVAGISRAVVNEMGNLTAEGVADDKPIGRPTKGTARTRGEGTAAHAQGEDIEGWWEVDEYIFGPGLGRLRG